MKSDDPLVADMLSMCLGEGEQFCKHDTLISQSLAVGNATLKAHQHHRALMEALKPGTTYHKIIVCLSLISFS